MRCMILFHIQEMENFMKQIIYETNEEQEGEDITSKLNLQNDNYINKKNVKLN